MTEQQAKNLIGRNNWKKFMVWMRGQTVGVNEDGSTDYYDHDVMAFKRKLDSGYDRQKDWKAWD